ncbi:hypothetical protein ACQPW1_40455 [Nocardia sp. CA-128927]|uniref:hypothetical protein n=1 Tax=Nocardia sp. CA-128927 TaxID=3239975 RepID=UPI003D95ECC4
MHLTVVLHGLRLDYAASPTAADNFVQEHRDHHYVDEATVIPGSPTGLDRLPNERLYEGP